MRLYTDSGNFQTLKLLLAAELSGVKLETQEVKSDEKGVVPYLQGNKLPVLEVQPKKFLFSANSAARYLLSKTVTETNESAVDQWLEWESACLYPTVFPFLLSNSGHGKPDPGVLASLVRFLKYLDAELKDSSTIVNGQMTAADVCIWSTLFPVLVGKYALKGWEKDYPSISSWFSALNGRTEYQKALQTVFPGTDTAAMKMSLTNQPVPSRVSVTETKPVLQQKAKPKEESSTVTEKVLASPEEISAAKEAWVKGRQLCQEPGKRVHPLLPEKGRRNILITSALPYVNNVPHLGNIIGCVLSADVFSRYCRLRNYNSVYFCGTDEYGTATETKAIAEGLTPQQICDKYSAIHRQIYEWFNIDFDYFGRTTTEQQTKIAQDIFWRLYKNGQILHDSVEQLHCEKCDRFLADRFVEGMCPLCRFDDARGDQCDACGKLINATELINPKCKLCKNSPVIKSTDHLFLDLPKLEKQLQAHLDKVFKEGTWTDNAKAITSSWIRDGLKPRCISRDLKWGTQVPLEGYTDKVFYVWFDAPIGYISITANYTEHWERWWKNPDNVEMYNFLGKDNVPFHSVIFPATLLGADDKFTIVNHMCATEYLNYEDGKFSKSRGTGVFGDQAKDTGIAPDIFRFYLLYVRPESQDSSFSWDDFLLKNNSELLNNLGNFVNRALMFVNNNFEGTIQTMELVEDDINLLALINRELHTYIDNMEEAKLRDSIRNILSISRLGNQFMQENKPWVLVKGSADDKKRAGTVVSLAANITCLLSVMLQPYMPEVSGTIQSQLAAPSTCNIIYKDFVCQLAPGHKIGTPAPLFQKIETSTIAELKKKFAGQGGPVQKAKEVKKGPTIVASPEEVERLTAEIAQQGNKVRELKAQKAEKSVIDAEVVKLLDLKKQMAAIKGEDSGPPSGGGKVKKEGNKKGDQSSSKQSAEKQPVGKPAGDVDQAAVDRLTVEVAGQGNKVREVKASKAEKSVINAEVAKLLDLKRQLALAQGLDPAAVNGGNKKKGAKKGEPSPQQASVKQEVQKAAGDIDQAVVERLTAEVTDQGNKVREVKASKADKSIIDAEVAKLIALKKELALAQGQDPTALIGGNKKKGKK